MPQTFIGRDLLPLAAIDAGPEPELELEPPSPSSPPITATSSASTASAWCGRRAGNMCWNATAEDELYDLAADPGEITNLAANAGSAAVLADMRRKLATWMAATKDPLLNQWTKRQLLEGRKYIDTPELRGTHKLGWGIEVRRKRATNRDDTSIAGGLLPLSAATPTNVKRHYLLRRYQC